MDLAEAFQIVIDFGRAGLKVMPPEEAGPLEEALSLLEDLAVNAYGDD